MPTTPTPDPERRAAAAARYRPRRSRGTLKDGRCRTDRCALQIDTEPCGASGSLSDRFFAHNPEHIRRVAS